MFSDDNAFALGYIVGDELESVCSEDTAYEYFCDIADKLIGYPITAVASFDSEPRERTALFRSRIRAIYRASVWGQFSLLCTGISTPAELDECLRILREIFCELESEGREFNGFIEKGICIDTPMMLYKFPQHSHSDLLCFDPERLRRLCTGVTDSDVGMKEIIEAIAKTCRENEKCSVAIMARDEGEAKKFINAFKYLKIGKIYFLSKRS